MEGRDVKRRTEKRPWKESQIFGTINMNIIVYAFSIKNIRRINAKITESIFLLGYFPYALLITAL